MSFLLSQDEWISKRQSEDDQFGAKFDFLIFRNPITHITTPYGNINPGDALKDLAGTPQDLKISKFRVFSVNTPDGYSFEYEASGHATKVPINTKYAETLEVEFQETESGEVLTWYNQWVESVARYPSLVEQGVSAAQLLLEKGLSFARAPTSAIHGTMNSLYSDSNTVVYNSIQETKKRIGVLLPGNLDNSFPLSKHPLKTFFTFNDLLPAMRDPIVFAQNEGEPIKIKCTFSVGKIAISGILSAIGF